MLFDLLGGCPENSKPSASGTTGPLIQSQLCNPVGFILSGRHITIIGILKKLLRKERSLSFSLITSFSPSLPPSLLIFPSFFFGMALSTNRTSHLNLCIYSQTYPCENAKGLQLFTGTSYACAGKPCLQETSLKQSPLVESVTNS